MLNPAVTVATTMEFCPHIKIEHRIIIYLPGRIQSKTYIFTIYSQRYKQRKLSDEWVSYAVSTHNSVIQLPERKKIRTNAALWVELKGGT